MYDTYSLVDAELLRTYQIALDNAPIHAANGDRAQAELNMDVAIDCRLARYMIERAPHAPREVVHDTFPYAVEVLRNVYNTSLANSPIHAANEQEEQAWLCTETAVDCRLAMSLLQRLTT